MESRKAYKLFRLRKDGTLGSLFINRKARIPLQVWMEASEHRTKGYAFRPGWHSLPEPRAPHLSTKGRVWMEVEIADFEEHTRPERQGGTWFLSRWMRVIGPAQCELL